MGVRRRVNTVVMRSSNCVRVGEDDSIIFVSLIFYYSLFGRESERNFGCSLLASLQEVLPQCLTEFLIIGIFLNFNLKIFIILVNIFITNCN